MVKQWLRLVLAVVFASFVLSGCDGDSSSKDSRSGGDYSGGGERDDDGLHDDDSHDGSDGVSPGDIAAAIHAVNIAGAQGFVITGAQSAPSSAGVGAASVSNLEPNSLYKVMADGRLERVAVQDEAGEELPRGAVQPLAVADLTPEFVSMSFRLQVQQGDEWGSWWDYDTRVYLVHKATGLAYEASEVLEDPAENEQVVRADAAGNIYVRGYGWRTGDSFRRINVDGLGHGPLSAVDLTTGGIRFEKFEVHHSGQFLTYAGEREHGTGIERRFVNLATNAVTNLRVSDESWMQRAGRVSVRGLDGEIYLLAQGADPEGALEREYQEEVYLFRLGIDEFGEASVAKLGALSLENASAHGWMQPWDLAEAFDEPYDLVRHVIGGKLIFRMWNNGFYELDIPERRVVFHTPTSGIFASRPRTLISTDYIWFLGPARDGSGDTIVRYDPVTRQSTQVSVGHDLELSRFELLTSERVLVEGYQISEDAKFRGEVSLDGEIVINEVIDPFAPAMRLLLPIHPVDFVVVDGDPRDWPLETRVLSGLEGSGPAGDDLLHYSEQLGNGRYLGLVEFAGEVAAGNRTLVHLSQTHQVELAANGARLIVIADGSRHAFADLGGRYAVGVAQEFSLPLAALGSETPFVERVERVADVWWGVVESHEAELLTDGDADAWRIDLRMQTPLGAATVELRLRDGYRLLVDGNGAVVIEGEESKDLLAHGGSFIVEELDIEVLIPVELLDDSSDLELEVLSTGLQETVVKDVLQ